MITRRLPSSSFIEAYDLPRAGNPPPLTFENEFDVERGPDVERASASNAARIAITPALSSEADRA